MKRTLHRAGRKIFLAFIFLVCLPTPALQAQDICFVCEKPIVGFFYTLTDEIKGEKVLACSNCVRQARCYLCGLPVGAGAKVLPDGRHICARDAKTVVLNTNEAAQVCARVKADLDRIFSRFIFFPANVDVGMIDRIDVESLFHQNGYDFESPNLLGCIRPVTLDQEKRYEMRLMSGLTLTALKATCAHEYAHAWVGDNVPPGRRATLARDAEEGFCELVAWCLLDSQKEEAQKQFILRNHYTRGQAALFIAANTRYGFDQILDWMKNGVTAKLDAGHLEQIREVGPVPAEAIASRFPLAEKMLAAHISSTNFAVPNPVFGPPSPTLSAPIPNPVLKLDGILWGRPPTAIINGRSLGIGDQKKIPFGQTTLSIQCLLIRKTSVKIRELEHDRELELSLPDD